MNQINILERPARSQFLKKLHRLLERPTDPQGLRWTSETTFEITIQDDLAIAALRPEFEFRSLGSFVRQLSYYNFKRLSDRRRSSERGTAKKGFIRFTHQSGYFTRGDASQISRITRRPRTNRPRRQSVVSNVSGRSGGSDERESSYPAVAWATQDDSTPFFHGAPSTSSQHGSTSIGMSETLPAYAPVPGDRPAPDFANKWRNYSPATAGFTNPARENAVAVAAAERQRRASMPVLDFSSNEPRPMQSSPASAPPSYIPLPSVSEQRRAFDPRPVHRATYSTDSIPTLSRLPEIPRALEYPPQGGSHGFRASEYPTPAFDSSTNVFFTQPTFIPPAPRGTTNLPDAPHAPQSRNFLSDLKFDPNYYGPGSTAHGRTSPPATLPSPSDHDSNGCHSPNVLSPTNELGPSSSCASFVPAPPSPPYYQHFGSSNSVNHDYGMSQSHQPRQAHLQASPEQSYFPSAQYQQHTGSSFPPSPWSPGLTQA